jgi:hypothetical protein
LSQACSSAGDGGPSAPDASPDVASPADASSDVAQDAVTMWCEPADVSGFTAPVYVPATGANQGKCTTTQIQSFYEQCLASTATQASCALLVGAMAAPLDKACAACIISRETDAKYGVIVEHKGFVSVNLAGCMEIADPTNGLACARAYQAADSCGRAACVANCPVIDQASLMIYQACVTQVEQHGCASLNAKAACAADEAAGGAAACFLGSTFQDLYFAVAPIFCGFSADAGAGDAGGHDASATDAGAPDASVADASGDAALD